MFSENAMPAVDIDVPQQSPGGNNCALFECMISAGVIKIVQRVKGGESLMTISDAGNATWKDFKARIEFQNINEAAAQQLRVSLSHIIMKFHELSVERGKKSDSGAVVDDENDDVMSHNKKEDSEKKDVDTNNEDVMQETDGDANIEDVMQERDRLKTEKQKTKAREVKMQEKEVNENSATFEKLHQFDQLEGNSLTTTVADEYSGYSEHESSSSESEDGSKNDMKGVVSSFSSDRPEPLLAHDIIRYYDIQMGVSEEGKKMAHVLAVRPAEHYPLTLSTEDLLPADHQVKRIIVCSNNARLEQNGKFRQIQNFKLIESTMSAEHKNQLGFGGNDDTNTLRGQAREQIEENTTRVRQQLTEMNSPYSGLIHQPKQKSNKQQNKRPKHI
jgi:hypothetical protein